MITTPSHWLLGPFGMVLYAAFIIVTVALFARAISARFRLMTIGRPAARFDRLGERIAGTLKFAIGQARMPRYPFVGILHIIIFWGFLVVVLTNLTLLIQGFAGGDFHLPLLWPDWITGKIYRAVLDLFEVAILFAAILAAINRIFIKPTRLTLSGEAILILGIIAVMMAADLLYEASGAVRAGHSTAGFASGFVASQLQGMSTEALTAIWSLSWWVHVTLILIFANILPYSKHFHVITSIPNVFFRDLDGPKKLSTHKFDMENYVPGGPEFYGSAQISDFTWKDNLDFYTCTECGRCSDNCPANLSGKPLSPKHLLTSLRNHLYHNDAELRKKPKNGEAKELNMEEYDPASVPNTLVPMVVEDEVLWSCTTCRACEVACPVFITYVDKIVDMRRRLVQVEARFPKELQVAYKGMENQANPWGIGADKRADWAEGLDVKYMADVQKAEYLYYVGCAAAFDDRMKKIAQAVVKILNSAGVDFAILGSEESCNGDPARRSGNELLFRTMAGMNIEVFKQYEFKKIITHCPHCFNTLKNEYPELGASYEVIHHSELIDKLLSEGKLTPKQGQKSRVVFHDSCYLGRYNDIYEAPREVVRKTGMEVVDPRRARKAGLCCGAGGARMWMEEKIGTRMNHERLELLMETKPDTIAVACPFCMTMLGDAMKDKFEDEKAQVPVLDVAEIIARALPEPQAQKEAAE